MVDKRIYSVAVAGLGLCLAVVAVCANKNCGMRSFDGGGFALLGILFGLVHEANWIVFERRFKNSFSGWERVVSFVIIVLSLAYGFGKVNSVVLSTAAWVFAGYLIAIATVRLVVDTLPAKSSS